MKYIITESQNLQLRKINFLKNYVENLLSKYEWFNGNVDIRVSTWANSGKVYPLYDILINTGGRNYHSYDESRNIEDSIETVFKILFPFDEHGRPTSVWSVYFK